MFAIPTIELRPHCALTPRGARWFFAGLCAAVLAVSAPFAARGLWPVVPFAGLELLVLAWALRATLMRRDRHESITVTAEAVVIESQQRGHRGQVVFPRHWAQVTLHRSAVPWHPSRLTIASHGRLCEVGAFLTEEERRELAGRLQRLIGRINESPPLSEAATALGSAQ